MYFCYGKNGYCDYPKDCEDCIYFLRNDESVEDFKVVTTNYDRIRNMSIEELARFMATQFAQDCYSCKFGCVDSPTDNHCVNGYYRWLNSEVSDD